MARTPKPASTPLPARRGRAPKTAGADAVSDALNERPGAGQRGQPSKRQAKTAISSVFESDPDKHPVADVDPLEAAAGPTPVEDAPIPEMTDPISAGASDAGLDSESTATPAAQWNRATDTVSFNWADIERTASQDGPNQAMAKLLVAARAEGANSRWPF